jgi:hypothetical protein
MRGGLTVEKTIDSVQFLADTIPRARTIKPSEKYSRFHSRAKTIRFCEAKYIQIYGSVYRNSEKTSYFFASPSARISDRRDIKR